MPSNDLVFSKLRSAVVLAGVGRGDWILCQVTSNPYGDPLAIPLAEGSFDEGSLRIDSFARPVKLWLGPDPDDTALTQAADALWTQWRSAADTEEAFSGRQLLASVGTGVLLWRTENERLALFAVGARYVDSVWLASVTPLFQSQGLRIAAGRDRIRGVLCSASDRAGTEYGASAA